MGEEQKIFSDAQRNVIYNEMLKPIKVKISEILLYDTEAAMKFLQKYNDILKCTNEQDILSKIAELELEIGVYEKNDGLQKSFEDKSQAIIQQIKDMQIDGDRLSLEDFEGEFDSLKQTYKTTFQKYSFQAREAIEQQLYELYGKLMVRRVREGAIDEVEVPKEDLAGLTIFMNTEIGRLSQNSNPQVQNAIERIKFKLMDRENAFQGDEVWRLLSYAQSQKFVEPNQSTRDFNQHQVTALAVVKEKKGLASRVKKVFQKEPQLPLQVEDLSKITLDWLAQHIPEDMLRKIEQQRLAKEGKNPESSYLPDSKTAIYDFVGKLDSDDKPFKFKDKIFAFEDEAGNKQEIRIVSSEHYSFYMDLVPEYLDEINRYRMAKEIKLSFDVDGIATKNILEYAIFLDNIFDTYYATDLARDYERFVEKPPKKFDNIMYGYTPEYKTKDFAAKSKLFKNLLKSYNSILKECQKTETNFRAKEEANRRAFYGKSKFREEIKQIHDAQDSNTSRENIQQGPNEPEKADEGEQK